MRAPTLCGLFFSALIALVTSSALSFNAAERDDDAPYRAIKQYGQCFIDAFTEATENTGMAYGAVELMPAYHQAIADIETCRRASEPDDCFAEKVLDKLAAFALWTETFPMTREVSIAIYQKVTPCSTIDAPHLLAEVFRTINMLVSGGQQ